MAKQLSLVPSLFPERSESQCEVYKQARVWSSLGEGSEVKHSSVSGEVQ